MSDERLLRKVWISELLFQEMGASIVNWGEPDADGFYTPTVYTDDHRLTVLEEREAAINSLFFKWMKPRLPE